ncbi:DnaJ-like subfamily C member 3 [Yasminevirus sp. GU-2018]|uniref:DnaJ-like subfamily C member 3 n=1 Tax=Yasminevirus sp. GU-2018 TaxID=2420051 RepID=A0A5K0UBJ7_9VIRU|nr:DnaJ-like subfamily C member 3 [Yasminevirus sp. GU-2018]
MISIVDLHDVTFDTMSAFLLKTRNGIYFTKTHKNCLLSIESAIYSFGRRYKSTFVGLPFKLSQEDANRVVLDNKKFLEDFKVSEARALIPYEQSSAPKECFVPFHGADISNVRSSYVGKYGIDRTEYYIAFEYNAALKMTVPVTRSRTVTDWYNTSGTLKQTSYPFGSYDTQVYAGFSYPRKEIENALKKENVVEIAPLTERMLRDSKNKRRIVHPHDMTISFAIEKMINKLHKRETYRAEQEILKKHDADHAEVNDLQIHIEDADIKLKSYYLPAFVYKTIKDDVPMYKFVDGFNGKYEGQYALSPLKTFLVGSLVGMGIAPFIGGPATVVVLLGRVILGGLASGVPSGLYAKYRHVYKQYKDDTAKEEAQDHNGSFQETDDDVRRRQDAEQFNEGAIGAETKDEDDKTYSSNNSNSSNRFRYRDSSSEIKEKLTLLGMNPDRAPSQAELKKAYYDSIKKWHPDVYKGDKVLGHKMTLQINEAYQVLQTTCK